MTRLKRSAINLLLFTLLVTGTVSGQDIYDGPHSREFARYLMQTHQFQLAASEWDRVLFLYPGDTVARLNLLKSYRLGQKPGEGLTRLNQWYPTGSLSRPFSLEGVQMSLLQSDYQTFNALINRSPGLSGSEKSDYQLGAWLLEGRWIDLPSGKRESSYSMGATDARLLDLYAKTRNVSRKSPAASVALSAVVPGLGKIYSHDWKDGLLSLLFVATNAWQSYRGFSKNGTRSVTGWVFGTLAVGFYSANLFGSWKSAKVYNAKQVDLIRHETESILFTR